VINKKSFQKRISKAWQLTALIFLAQIVVGDFNQLYPVGIGMKYRANHYDKQKIRQPLYFQKTTGAKFPLGKYHSQNLSSVSQFAPPSGPKVNNMLFASPTNKCQQNSALDYVPSGLINPGACCFMIASIQLILNNDLLRDYVLKADINNKPVTRVLQNILFTIMAGKKNIDLNLLDLYILLQGGYYERAGYIPQEDSAVILDKLCEAISEEYSHDGVQGAAEANISTILLYLYNALRSTQLQNILDIPENNRDDFIVEVISYYTDNKTDNAKVNEQIKALLSALAIGGKRQSQEEIISRMKETMLGEFKVEEKRNDWNKGKGMKVCTTETTFKQKSSSTNENIGCWEEETKATSSCHMHVLYEHGKSLQDSLNNNLKPDYRTVKEEDESGHVKKDAKEIGMKTEQSIKPHQNLILHVDHCSGHYNDNISFPPDGLIVINNHKYEITGFIVRKGNACVYEYGHYFTVVRRGDCWYECNDAGVKKTDPKSYFGKNYFYNYYNNMQQQIRTLTLKQIYTQSR
jgi:hypothetical protein